MVTSDEVILNLRSLTLGNLDFQHFSEQENISGVCWAKLAMACITFGLFLSYTLNFSLVLVLGRAALKPQYDAFL